MTIIKTTELYIFIYFLNKFIYFWLRWVFVAARAFSSCSERELLFVAVRASHCGGFSCCKTQALGAWAQ